MKRKFEGIWWERIPNDYTCKMKKGCNLPSTVVGTNRFIVIPKECKARRHFTSGFPCIIFGFRIFSRSRFQNFIFVQFSKNKSRNCHNIWISASKAKKLSFVVTQLSRTIPTVASTPAYPRDYINNENERESHRPDVFSHLVSDRRLVRGLHGSAMPDREARDKRNHKTQQYQCDRTGLVPSASKSRRIQLHWSAAHCTKSILSFQKNIAEAESNSFGHIISIFWWEEMVSFDSCSSYIGRRSVFFTRYCRSTNKSDIVDEGSGGEHSNFDGFRNKKFHDQKFFFTIQWEST